MDISLSCCYNLIEAVSKDCFPCVQKYTADIDQQEVDDDGRNALFFALDRPAILEYLLKTMASKVNDKDKHGFSVLDISLRLYNFDAAKILIHNGADVNSTYIDGFPILFFAIDTCNLSLFEFLLDNNADVNICDKNLYSPLHHAACKSPEYLEALVANGAKYEKKPGIQNILMTAINKNNTADRIPVIKYLIGHPYFVSDLYDEGDDGFTILHVLAISGDYPALKLIPLNIIYMFINKGNCIGQTPLHLSVKYIFDFNSYKFVKKLLKCGALLNVRDVNNKIPQDYVINEYEGNTQIQLNILKLLSEWQDLPF